MNEVKRMQQLAEIKISNPIKFRKIPFSLVKKELLNDELGWMKERNEEDPEGMTEEYIQQVINEIESINDHKDMLNYFEGQGFSRNEAWEQIFTLLVNKDA